MKIIKNLLRILVSLIIGHCCLRAHFVKLKKWAKSCGDSPRWNPRRGLFTHRISTICSSTLFKHLPEMNEMRSSNPDKNLDFLIETGLVYNRFKRSQYISSQSNNNNNNSEKQLADLYLINGIKA